MNQYFTTSKNDFFDDVFLKVVSFTNLHTSWYGILAARSLIIIKNNTGPNIDTCGSSLDMFFVF